MDKRPALLACVLMTILMAISACTADKDPKVFEKHLAEYPDIRKKYIYQSVLRLANVKDDPDFDKLIRDVRKITIYMPPREDTTYQIKSVRNSLSTEGYEQLIDVRTAEGDRVGLWVNESLPEDHYVAFLDTESDDYILEVDGQINIEYLSSIAIADQGSLRELLK